jgi:hypothetical protein
VRQPAHFSDYCRERSGNDRGVECGEQECEKQPANDDVDLTL